MSEIINRVSNSKLITLDIKDFEKELRVSQIDIVNWLEKESILIEKSFRKQLTAHNWKQYKNQFLLIYCSNDAIVPQWAYLLISLYAKKYAKQSLFGTYEQNKNILLLEHINSMNIKLYTNKPVIIKGCSTSDYHLNLSIRLVERLRNVSKSIFFGEACSSVPLFKNRDF